MKVPEKCRYGENTQKSSNSILGEVLGSSMCYYIDYRIGNRNIVIKTLHCSYKLYLLHVLAAPYHH